MIRDMAKHAYLIIAHKNDKTFKTLIELLDHKDNDIFVHMDLKLADYDELETEKIAKKSKIYHAERTSVQWAGYSMVNAELLLLEKAINTGKYEYYHLISGEDLPLKKQSEIHKFFEKNAGKEFLDFQHEKFTQYERVRYWYPFQERFGRRHYNITKLLVLLQRPFVRRNKDITFQKGTQWFSITDDFARYVVSKKDWIKRVFRKTWGCDEVFLQTVFVNSKFKKNVFHCDEKVINLGWGGSCCMRHIDWERGAPYTFRSDDYDELMNSYMCFGRKFDAKVDSKIIDKIKKHLSA